METYEAILSRRSIRKYTDEAVPEEMVTKLLRAAMSAPSASNQQPWYFIAITERVKLEKITEFHPYSSMLHQAPLAILVCGDLKSETHIGLDYWVQDCSAATENMLLAAHSAGLGAVWLGIHPRKDRVDKIKELFGLPENIIPLSLVSIGFPGEQKPPSERFDSSRIHYNNW